MRYALVLMAALAGGCITEGDAQLVDQTRRIGEFTEKKGIELKDDTLVQAGKDAKENMIALTRGVGLPKTPTQDYSPKASAAAREQSKVEHDTQDAGGAILGVIKDVAGSTFPWAVPIISGAYALIVSLRKRLSDTKNLAVYSGVNKVIEELKKRDNGEEIAKAVIDTMRATAGNFNVYREIKSDLSRLRDAGKI